jgi:hypothetical protein
MEQSIPDNKEPLLHFLPIEASQESLDLKRHCPFIGLAQDSDTVMAFPNTRNLCHRPRTPQEIRLDYQRTHCLTFAHRHCPVLLKSSRKLPAEIAVSRVWRRSIFLMLSITTLIILLAAAFLFFGEFESTSANDWLFDPGREQAQQELFFTPTVQLDLDALEDPLPTALPAPTQVHNFSRR